MESSFLNKSFAVYAVCALLFTANLQGVAAQTAHTLMHGSVRTAQAAEPISSAPEVYTGILTLDECEALLVQYYRSSAMDKNALFTGFERLHTALCAGNAGKETMLRYLAHAKLISILYSTGGDRQCKKYLNIIDKQLFPFFNRTLERRNREKLTNEDISNLYLRYADYLYMQLSLETKQFSGVSALPLLYRTALYFNPNNTEALVKFAFWHIFPAHAGTVYYNSFIESQEHFIDELNLTDRFTAYLLYSLYYMKKYNSRKGREYLSKAVDLFPNHAMLLHLYNNYKKGIFAL